MAANHTKPPERWYHEVRLGNASSNGLDCGLWSENHLLQAAQAALGKSGGDLALLLEESMSKLFRVSHYFLGILSVSPVGTIKLSLPTLITLGGGKSAF